MKDEASQVWSRLAQRVDELEATKTRLSALLETSRALSSAVKLDQLLEMVMRETTQVLDADRSSLFLVDRARGEMWSKIAEGLEDVEIRFSINLGLVGHAARTGEIVNVPDAYADPRFNPEIDRGTGFRTRSVLVVPLVDTRGDVIAVIQALNKRTDGPFDDDDVEILSALAAQVAVSIENARLYARIEGLFDAFVHTIVTAIDARDPTTAGHSVRVAAYAMNLARALRDVSGPGIRPIRYTADEMTTIRYAAILHDVGKIGVREQVLCKRHTLLVPEMALVEERIRRARAEVATERTGDPSDHPSSDPRNDGPNDATNDPTNDPASGCLSFYDRLLEVLAERREPAPLTPEQARLLRAAFDRGLLTHRQYECLSLTRTNLSRAEWQDMTSHVTQSYELLRQIPWPEPLARVPEIAWSHHEKLDGTGYPRGVDAESIPYEGRILAVADIYDALIAPDRPYKGAYSHEQARAILEEEASHKRVDGDLVRLFFDARCFELPAQIPRPPPHPPEEPPL